MDNWVTHTNRILVIQNQRLQKCGVIDISGARNLCVA
jgi:hypothetical protein